MDIKQLTTFVTLSQTLNYQKAADQLKYAPSTLFKHIRLLEQELGVNLFYKSGRQLRPTKEGQNFQKHAEQILEDYHRAIDSLSPDKELTGNIMIGGCEMNLANCLLEMLISFSQKCPRARMSMTTSPNADVISMVKKDIVNIGYYFDIEERNHDGLQTVYLYREPVFLMASENNLLARRGNLHYEDLEGIDFVFPHDDCCFVVEMLSLLKKRGVSIGKTTYLGGLQLVVEQAHKDHALMFVSASVAKRFHQVYGMARLDMDEEPLWVWESIVFKNYDSLKPAAKALIRHSMKYARSVAFSDPR